MGLWRRYLVWRQRNVARIEATAAGFRVMRGGATTGIGWESVVRIAAFKRDLMAVDLLCLLIQTEDAIVEFDEDMEGFAAMLAGLERRFGIAPEWRLSVLFPAFEMNAAILYDRDAGDG